MTYSGSLRDPETAASGGEHPCDMEAHSECAATLSTATAENTLKMSTIMPRHSAPAVDKVCNHHLCGFLAKSV